MALKVVTIVGARPQFIKAAVMSQALRAKDGVKEILLHTGQHYDDTMSHIFFKELEMPQPDYHLGIGGGTHGQNTGRMIEGVEKVLLKEMPNWVIVYGDTDSTLAGALAAVKLHIPVAHVEAGLRSFNRKMPEEINRVLTDHAAHRLFAPTETAVRNLKREGISDELIRLVGDVMYDAALFYGTKADLESRILERVALEPKEYILATVHRAENTDQRERLEAILQALVEVHKDIPVVLPVHPRTRKMVKCFDLMQLLEGVKTIDPVVYLDMMMLEKNAALIATDSGGVQKEAFFYRVPCVTLREQTEWVELVELGWNRLTPLCNTQVLYDSIMQAIGTRGADVSLYGDGSATEKISRTIYAESIDNGSMTN